MEILFNPKTIAVVGASADSSKIGNRLVRNLLDHGFKGKVFLVNPKGGYIFDRAVYTDIAELPPGLDIAFLAVPFQATLLALQQCISKRVKYVVALTAGFKEASRNGGRLEKNITECIRKSSTRLVGPNCAGLCNTWASFHGSMEIYPRKGNISLISQSGSLCSAFSSNMVTRASGISKYISIGNKADINVADLLRYFGDDPTTECIALYLEDVSEGRSFFETARGVARKKPIVILKSGRTEQGARATLSHTGAIAGEDLVAKGAFRQMGLARVNELTQLYDVTATLSKIGPLRGKKIAILSDAGGPGVLATDAAIDYGLEVPRLSASAQGELSSRLAGFASLQNPVDMTFNRDVRLYARCIETICRDKMDAIIVTIPSHFSVKNEIVSTLGELRSKVPTPMAVAWLSADEVEEQRRMLWQTGIPAFLSPGRAAYCLAHLSSYGLWLNHEGEQYSQVQGHGKIGENRRGKILI